MKSFSTNDLGHAEAEYTEDNDAENVAVCSGCMRAFILFGDTLSEYQYSGNYCCDWCMGLQEDDNSEYGVD